MNGKPCASSDRVQSWESIDWTAAHAQVKKLQMRIVRAQTEGRIGKVKPLILEKTMPVCLKTCPQKNSFLRASTRMPIRRRSQKASRLPEQQFGGVLPSSGENNRTQGNVARHVAKRKERYSLKAKNRLYLRSAIQEQFVNYR